MLKICKTSFIYSFGALIYIGLVSWVIQNGEKLFGKMTGFLAPVAFLLLFSLSGLIVGSLILGKPIMLYLDGQKKEAVLWLFAASGWMLLYTIIAIIILIVR